MHCLSCFSLPTVEDIWRCLAIHLHPIYAFHAVSDVINVKSIVIRACFVLYLAGLRISCLHPEGQEGLRSLRSYLCRKTGDSRDGLHTSKPHPAVRYLCAGQRAGVATGAGVGLGCGSAVRVRICTLFTRVPGINTSINVSTDSLLWLFTRPPFTLLFLSKKCLQHKQTTIWWAIK